MFSSIILPIIIFAALGILAGVLLTVASKVFHVETDERVQAISDSLPQANCGACGFAGCGDYAAAVVEKGAATNLCRPGGVDTARKISSIMGTSAEELTPMTAVVHCRGNCDAVKQKFEFDGTLTCSAAKRFYSGAKSCAFGCLGLGDCVNVCDENAIQVVNGVAEVTGVCLACGKCEKVCPQKLISIKPITRHIDVKCSSKDNGKNTKLACSNGCIGCKICEKKCPGDAIHVNDFHASIDYDKCTGCGECFKACPVKAITNCEQIEDVSSQQ